MKINKELLERALVEGVEIDAFMVEKPKKGKKYWSLDTFSSETFSTHIFDGKGLDLALFELGIWDNEEKAQRSAPLMRQRLTEMAGVVNRTTK